MPPAVTHDRTSTPITSEITGFASACALLSFHVLPQTNQIRVRTETLSKIKEENIAVANEIATERRWKKKLSQHRVRRNLRILLRFHQDDSSHTYTSCCITYAYYENGWGSSGPTRTF